MIKYVPKEINYIPDQIVKMAPANVGKVNVFNNAITSLIEVIDIVNLD